MAPAVCSTATAMKPSAAASGRPRAHGLRQSPARCARRPASSGASPVGPNTRGKGAGVEAAKHQVGVGDRGRAAAAIGGRTRDRRRRWPARPGRAGRRRPGSSRRRRPRSRRPASARAASRRRPAPCRAAPARRRSGRRRSRCRPCRGRAPRRRPPLRRSGHADDAAGRARNHRVAAAERPARTSARRRGHEEERRATAVGAAGSA